MASDSVTSVLQDIINWMDAHDDVLPTVHKEPTLAQQEEATLRRKYKKYLGHADGFTKEQRKLHQEIDRRKKTVQIWTMSNSLQSGQRGTAENCQFMPEMMSSRARWRTVCCASNQERPRVPCCKGDWMSSPRQLTKRRRKRELAALYTSYENKKPTSSRKGRPH